MVFTRRRYHVHPVVNIAVMITMIIQPHSGRKNNPEKEKEEDEEGEYGCRVHPQQQQNGRQHLRQGLLRLQHLPAWHLPTCFPSLSSS
mmetsp:Transcript_21034/g.49990  ORF Transcript_21034/g.49990 Transcript_21034/m.49990 type:complete len:88 (-) Transcript_21034:1460-1723(-)